ncbi:hypothetical protein [Nonomuraea angiospora]
MISTSFVASSRPSSTSQQETDSHENRSCPHGVTLTAATLAIQVSPACLYTAMRVAEDPARLPNWSKTPSPGSTG